MPESLFSLFTIGRGVLLHVLSDFFYAAVIKEVPNKKKKSINARLHVHTLKIFTKSFV